MDPVDHDGNVDKQECRQWVSVPLNKIETSLKYSGRVHVIVSPGPKRSRVRSSGVSQESTKVLKETGTGELYDNAVDEFLKAFKGCIWSEEIVHNLVKNVIETTQHFMELKLREKTKSEANAAAERQNLRGEILKLKQINRTVLAENLRIQREGIKLRIRDEKTQREANAAVELQKLQDDIMKLNQTNQTVLAEKSRIEDERDKLQKDYESTVLQLKDKKNAVAVAAALSDELAKEQEKSCCQICFSAPRDVIVLPCTHFQYCHECLQKYQKRRKECPTCRGRIHGILQCSLSMS